MSVFVTVGSTSFDELVKSVCSSDVLQLLKNQGLKKVVLQIGCGEFIPEKNYAIEIEWYRFKDSTQDDLKEATLVIGHAGAGTILESLTEQKPLITVLNDKLMNNHQSELAEQMEKEGYLLSCSCHNLYETLKKYFKAPNLKPFLSESNMFPAFLDEVMGVS